MGHNYSLLNNQYGVCNILSNEIVILENNINKINTILELLNDKCDNQCDTSLHEVWDYSDLQ